MRPKSFLAAFFLASSVAAAGAGPLAAQPRGAVSSASQTALVEALTIQHAAQRAASDAAWNSRYGEALRRIDRTVQQSRADARRRAQAEASRLRAEGRVGELEGKLLAADRKYADAIAERQSLVAELGRQSRAFEAETAAYRSLMTRVVADASPEKLEWLSRYAAGDRREAYPVLQQLTEVENEARTVAATRVATEVAETARQQNADNQRAIGVLAMDMMGRGEATAEQVIAAWEKVLRYDDRQRLDRLVLARLWEWDGDDVKAAEARAAAARLDDSPGLAERHPVASMVSTFDIMHPGGMLRTMANIARSQPTESAPGVAIPPLQIPMEADAAPLLEALADCQEAIQARLDWTAAREREQALRTIGMGDGAAGASQAKPAVDCRRAAAPAASVMSNSEISPQTREALVGSLLGLAESLVAIGENEASLPLAAAADAFCRTWRPSSGSQAILRTQCALGSVMSALRVSQAAESGPAAARAEQGLKMVDGLRIEDFPKPQQAFILVLIYSAGAQALFNSGRETQALAEARKGFAIADRLLNTTTNFAVGEIGRIALRTGIAGMTGSASPGEATTAFQEAERSVMAFVAAHPNSGPGCRELLKYADQATTWLANSNKDGGIALLDRLARPLERCDVLIARLYPDQVPQGIGELLNLVRYMKVALAASEAERLDEAGRGFERMVEAADKLAPSPIVARMQTAALGELAAMQVRRSEPAAALRTAQRLAELGRRHGLTDKTILALSTQASAHAALGDAAAAQRQWVEKHKLCALLPVGEAGEEDDGAPAADVFAEEMQEAGAMCRAAVDAETQAVRAFFEARAADLERGAGESPAPGLAETLFYLAVALERAQDVEGSKKAYRRSIELKAQPALAREVSLDPTPFAMARLGGLEQDDKAWGKVRAWLERERGRRALGAEEEKLLAHARAVAARPAK